MSMDLIPALLPDADGDEASHPSFSKDAEKPCYRRQEVWLRAYEKLGYKQHTCDETGISIWAVMKWQENNVYGFNDRVKQSYERHLEGWERGMDARLEAPQGNRGSDILYMFKLKALAPEKYRETVNISDNSGILGTLKALQQLGALNREHRGAVDGKVRELKDGEGVS